MRNFLAFLVCLFTAAPLGAQPYRRVAYGVGFETGIKAQILSATGSPYALRGGYGVHASLQTLPASGYGFRSVISIGYAVDEARYRYAPGLVFSAHRHLARTEFDAFIPTRGEVFWLTAGIGVDWNIGQTARLTLYQPSQAVNLSGEPAVSVADLDLFLARRLLVPAIRIGPALRFPTGEEGRAAWLQLFIRQDFLDAYEAPVVVTMPDGGLRPHSVLVSQRPTYVGIAASYFF